VTNSILVTGLGNGVLGECAPCNYNAFQLICNPSMLLWIDRIVIPKNIWDVIIGEKDNLVDKAVKLILESYDKAGLVDIIDTSLIFNNKITKILEEGVSNDINLLKSLNPDMEECNEKDSHFALRYNGVDYCYPKILSIYGDLYLAETIGANCLFDQDDLNFCQLKFGLTYQNPINSTNTVMGIDKIIKNIIPNVHPTPNFLSERIALTQCNKCKKQGTCEGDYFFALETAMKQYAEWREYDEFYLLRENMQNIIDEVTKNSDIVMPDDIYDAFIKERNRVNDLIHIRLSKIKKFSDLITALSVPASIISTSLGASLPVTLTSVALSGLSALTTVGINRFEEKYKWVNFSINN